MNKEQFKKELQATIDRSHSLAKDRVEQMSEQKHNPQVALMIEKNKGYMMALEDVTEFLSKRGF